MITSNFTLEELNQLIRQTIEYVCRDLVTLGMLKQSDSIKFLGMYEYRFDEADGKVVYNRRKRV